MSGDYELPARLVHKITVMDANRSKAKTVFFWHEKTEIHNKIHRIWLRARYWLLLGNDSFCVKEIDEKDANYCGCANSVDAKFLYVSSRLDLVMSSTVGRNFDQK